MYSLKQWPRRSDTRHAPSHRRADNPDCDTANPKSRPETSADLRYIRQGRKAYRWNSQTGGLDTSRQRPFLAYLVGCLNPSVSYQHIPQNSPHAGNISIVDDQYNEKKDPIF